MLSVVQWRRWDSTINISCLPEELSTKVDIDIYLGNRRGEKKRETEREKGNELAMKSLLAFQITSDRLKLLGWREWEVKGSWKRRKCHRRRLLFWLLLFFNVEKCDIRKSLRAGFDILFMNQNKARQRHGTERCRFLAIAVMDCDNNGAAGNCFVIDRKAEF